MDDIKIVIVGGPYTYKEGDPVEFEEFGPVKIAKHFSYLFKPYHGCPRGPEGIHCAFPNEEDDIEFIKYEMEHANGRFIKGVDDTFVCISRLVYKYIMERLDSAEKELKELREFKKQTLEGNN